MLKAKQWTRYYFRRKRFCLSEQDMAYPKMILHSPNFLQMVFQLHENQCSQIRVTGDLSEHFPISKSVKHVTIGDFEIRSTHKFICLGCLMQGWTEALKTLSQVYLPGLPHARIDRSIENTLSSQKLHLVECTNVFGSTEA